MPEPKVELRNGTPDRKTGGPHDRKTDEKTQISGDLPTITETAIVQIYSGGNHLWL
jgi:hypothetical protein